MNNNSQLMVLARADLEALGCEVRWYDPNEVHITTGEINNFIILSTKTSVRLTGWKKI